MAKDLIGGGALTARGTEGTDKSIAVTEQGVTAGSFPGLDGGKIFNEDGSLTDTGSQLEGKLSPEELNKLREFENNKFEGGTGADDGTTVKDIVSKETWDTIKSVAPNLIGGAVGIFAGPVAGYGARNMANKYMGNDDKGQDKGGHNVGGAKGTSTGTGGGYNTGGGGVTGL
jgi:hypothetical protein